MADFDITITSHVDDIKNALPENIERALLAMGITAESYAKQNCPIVTGRLMNSITYQADVGSKSVVIGTNVEYGKYVELGHYQEVGRYVPALGKALKTPFVAGKPFLRPAIENHVDEYRSLTESALKS